jgi:hypothetical protein
LHCPLKEYTVLLGNESKTDILFTGPSKAPCVQDGTMEP